MSDNTDYIHQLMTEKLAGVINALDEAYLDELIGADPAISKIWALMCSTIPAPKKQSFKIVSSKWIKNNRLLAAAALVTIIYASSYFVRYITHSSRRSFNNIENLYTSPLVQLQLSNGTVINLSAASDTIQVGNARLSTVNRTLVFSANTSMPIGINTITVPIGQTYRVVLPDGSIVWLNSATEMRFPTIFSDTERVIMLNGEAYLEIVSNASKSFAVNAGASTIQVLGTAFNINNYDRTKLKVSLVNGSVKIKTCSTDQQLKPGEQAIISSDDPIIVQGFEAERELSWREGVYYFTDASLEEISKIIPRWFGNHVEVDNTTVGKSRFTGRMQRDLPITEFLETLKATTYIQYEIDKSGTIHFK